MRAILTALVCLCLTISGFTVSATTALTSEQTAADDHEVWIIDQSDTSGETGGMLYIYSGAALASPDAMQRPDLAPETIDFAQAAAGVGDGVGRRPHMLLFNPTNTHAVIANVLSSHVYIIRAADRAVIESIRVGEPGDAARQAHAAFVAPDGSLILVANQNGKKLERVWSDFAAETFSYDPADALNLAALENEGRPDNAPICPVFAPDGRHAFVTLRGGGLLVVDAKASPMRVVASFDRNQVGPNGCGGIASADGRTMYITSGGGTPARPLAFDLYAFDLAGLGRTPPTLNPPLTPYYFDPPSPLPNCNEQPAECGDSHGAVLTSNGRYLWIGDRAANQILIFDTRSNGVAGTVDLAFDAAPDLMDISPRGDRIYAAFRGPNPLTGNVPDVANAVGDQPGVGVIAVNQTGEDGALMMVAPISRVVDGVERADPHGLRVRPRSGS